MEESNFPHDVESPHVVAPSFSFGELPTGFTSEEELAGWYEGIFRRFEISVELYEAVVRVSIGLRALELRLRPATSSTHYSLNDLVDFVGQMDVLAPEDYDRLCRSVGIPPVSSQDSEIADPPAADDVVQLGGLDPRSSDGVGMATSTQPPASSINQSYSFKCLEGITAETSLDDLAAKDFARDFDTSTLKYTYDVQFEQIPMDQLEEMVNVVRSFRRWKNTPTLRHAIVTVFNLTKPTGTCIQNLLVDVNESDISVQVFLRLMNGKDGLFGKWIAAKGDSASQESVSFFFLPIRTLAVLNRGPLFFYLRAYLWWMTPPESLLRHSGSHVRRKDAFPFLKSSGMISPCS